jgi:D-threo-aldose 1-dehydrogenase
VRERQIARTGVRLSEVGFGAASLGNLYRETTDAEAEDAVDAAWSLGIRYFDTAPHYGLGLSERRLGRALRNYPRAEYAISTKVGRLLVPNEFPVGSDNEGFVVPDDVVRVWDFSRDGIRRSLDASLERLGLEHVDILYAHDPDQADPDAGMRAAPFLVELREQGLAGAVGVGTNSGIEAARLFARTDLDVAMLAGRYTLLEQESLDDALRLASSLGRSVVAAGVFNSGLLANSRPSGDSLYDYRPANGELIRRVNSIADVCESFGVSLPQAAIAFPLTHPRIVSVALGMRTALQVLRNVDLYDAGAPVALWNALKKQGLMLNPAPIDQSMG